LELVLFEDIKDDNYYRAFKLVERIWGGVCYAY
jgi:hypothetical protein